MAPDRERPRANLYNVIKRLRENNVSSLVMRKNTNSITHLIPLVIEWLQSHTSHCQAQRHSI